MAGFMFPDISANIKMKKIVLALVVAVFLAVVVFWNSSNTTPVKIVGQNSATTKVVETEQEMKIAGSPLIHGIVEVGVDLQNPQ